MTYDRRAIMNDAWAKAHAETAASIVPLCAKSRRYIFKHALRNAWMFARMALRAARQSPAMAGIRARIDALEGLSHWTPAEYRQREQLTAELCAAA